MAAATPNVEVQWASGTWTDVTDSVQSFSEVHGGSPSSNPDRPFPQPATGSLILEGQTAPTGRRFACRAVLDGGEEWSGWIQAPRITRDGRSTRWLAEGKSRRPLSENVETAIPAGTTLQMMASDAFDPLGDITARNLVARNLKEVRYSGPIGGLLGRAALVASAECVETKTGSIVVANPILSEPPADVPTISAADTLIFDYADNHLIDRIRNRAIIRIDEIDTVASEGFSVVAGSFASRQGGAVGSALPAELSWQYVFNWPSGTPQLDNATYTNWRVEVINAEWSVPVRYQQFRTQRNRGGAFEVTSTLVDASGLIQVSNRSARVSASIVSDLPRSTRIAITADSSPTESFQQAAWYVDTDFDGNVHRRSPPTLLNVNRSNTWSAFLPITVQGAQLPASTRATIGLRVTLRIRATRTTGDFSPQEDLVADVATSQAEWGVRPLDLPFWIASTGTAVLNEQLAALANVRREHVFTIPLAEPAARTVDAGDYVSLRIGSTNEVCLVVGRGLAFGDGQLPRVTFRCLETGTRVEHNDVFLGSADNPIYLGDTDNRVHLYR